MRINALSVLLVGLVFLSLPIGAVQQKEEPVYDPGDGVSLPRVVSETRPHYTPDAMQARVQGTVWLRCVVSTDGKPRHIEIAKPLHEQLDANAVEALEQWVFEPGKKDGKPVPVRITVEITYTLK